MASKAKRRIKLECTSATCKRINYFPNKSKGIKDRLQLIKYCRHCKKHVEHKETK